MTEENNNSDLPKINLPESDIPMQPLTITQLEKAADKRISRIDAELKKGFDFIRHHPKTITFFGSARFDENNEYYKKARRIAKRVSQEGYAVVTGGGPGIMEAANRGATEGDGNDFSLGICIELPNEQVTNPYVTNHRDFRYFFTRKVILSFSAEAYVYFPGGFGTLDEFFEIVTLIQTRKIEKIPMILVGERFWEPLKHVLERVLLREHGTINEDDLDLFTITDDEEEIMEIIKNAPLRQE